MIKFRQKEFFAQGIKEAARRVTKQITNPRNKKLIAGYANRPGKIIDRLVETAARNPIYLGTTPTPIPSIGAEVAAKKFIPGYKKMTDRLGRNYRKSRVHETLRRIPKITEGLEALGNRVEATPYYSGKLYSNCSQTEYSALDFAKKIYKSADKALSAKTGKSKIPRLVRKFYRSNKASQHHAKRMVQQSTSPGDLASKVGEFVVSKPAAAGGIVAGNVLAPGIPGTTPISMGIESVAEKIPGYKVATDGAKRVYRKFIKRPVKDTTDFIYNSAVNGVPIPFVTM